MEVPGFRPRYKFVSPLSGAIIAQRITDRLRAHNPHGLWLKNAHYHLTLNFPRKTAHAWTPQMDINFEDMGEGRNMVRCVIGPSPGIWMLFVAGYLVLTLLGLTGATLGTAQLMLHNATWGFIAVPATAACIAVLFVVERSGRHRAQGDMRVLKDFVDEALGCDCLKLAVEQGT